MESGWNDPRWAQLYAPSTAPTTEPDVAHEPYQAEPGAGGPAPYDMLPWQQALYAEAAANPVRDVTRVVPVGQGIAISHPELNGPINTLE